MISSQAQTVAEYLEALPEERRKVVAALRKVVKKHLPKDSSSTCLEDLPMDVIAQAVASVTPDEYIAIYESVKRK